MKSIILTALLATTVAFAGIGAVRLQTQTVAAAKGGLHLVV